MNIEHRYDSYGEFWAIVNDNKDFDFIIQPIGDYYYLTYFTRGNIQSIRKNSFESALWLANLILMEG